MMMRAKKFVGIFFFFSVIFSLTAPVIRGEEKGNLVLNPSFEEEEQVNKPTDWWLCQRFTLTQTISSGSYAKDKEIAHSGNCCVMIEGKESAAWISNLYVVKGNTTYELSAWVKSDGMKAGGYNLQALEFVKGTHTKTRGSETSNAPSDWQKITVKFTTIPTITGLELRLCCSGIGKVWFDDVSLVEVTEADISANLLKNSSFEIAAVPGIPDNWGIHDGGVWGAHYAEKWQKWWGLDKSNAYDGKNSLRIYRPFNDGDPEAEEYSGGDFILSSLWYYNSVEPGNPYTLSIYLKSDTPGFKATMQVSDYGKGAQNEDVRVDTSWKRYILTTPPLTSGIFILYIIPQQKGTLWIDAAQFEKGTIASAYVPSREETAVMADKGEYLTVEEQLAMNKKKQPAVPRTVCAEASSPPKIDGTLDDECWQKAKKLDLVFFKGGKPEEPTTGYILQDEENLYIGMKCDERQMDKLRTKIKDRDGPIWSDDCVEIFIDPNLDKKSYYRVGINAIGTKFDGKMVDSLWNGDWEGKTFQGENFWSLEIKLPFALFEITPFVGDTWGINLCRTNTVVSENSSWSPVYTSFHNPERFGRITGLHPNRFQKYCYSLKNISLEHANIAERSSNVVVEVGNYTGEEKKIAVEATVKAGEDTSTAKSDCLLKAGEQRKVKVGPFAVRGKTADKVTVSLLEPEGKKALVTLSADKVTIPPLIEVVPELNYYTDEGTASIFILSGLDNNFIRAKRMRLSVELKDKEEKETFFSKKTFFTNNTTSIEFPMNTLKPGEYLIFAKLTDEKGGIIGEAKEPLLKLEKRANEVKINHMNRMLIVDDKPFFPFGINWGLVFPNDLAKTRKVFKALSQRYNLMTWDIYPSINLKETAELLDIAQENNLKIVIWYVPWLSMGREEVKKDIERVVPALKDKPALLCWGGISDESSATEEWYNLTRDKCKWIKELDPYHPTALWNHSPSFDSWKKFGYPGDVIQEHDYNFGSPYYNDAVASYAQQIANAGKTTRELRKPFWYMPQSSSSWQMWSRGPSAMEAEAVTYLPVVHGATEIEYYMYDQIGENLWKKIGALGKEIKELTPILASCEPVSEITAIPSDIQILVKKYQGKYYLITVNVSKEKTEATFDISSLKAPKNSKIKVMFEERNIQREREQSFTDNFESYQRHVYAITP